MKLAVEDRKKKKRGRNESLKLTISGNRSSKKKKRIFENVWKYTLRDVKFVNERRKKRKKGKRGEPLRDIKTEGKRDEIYDSCQSFGVRSMKNYERRGKKTLKKEEVKTRESVRALPKILK